jgi:hypothetical protein
VAAGSSPSPPARSGQHSPPRASSPGASADAGPVTAPLPGRWRAARLERWRGAPASRAPSASPARRPVGLDRSAQPAASSRTLKACTGVPSGSGGQVRKKTVAGGGRPASLPASRSPPPAHRVRRLAEARAAAFAAVARRLGAASGSPEVAAAPHVETRQTIALLAPLLRLDGGSESNSAGSQPPTSADPVSRPGRSDRSRSPTAPTRRRPRGRRPSRTPPARARSGS